MRLTSLLLVIACLHVSATSLSQTVTLHVKDRPIPQVLESIESQTGYVVVYNDGYVSNDMLVSLQVKNEPLERVLDELLKPSGLTYQIREKIIAITGRERPSDHRQQPLQVSVYGRVFEADTPPIPLQGATVSVVGTSQQTMTDAAGNFQLTGVSTDATLLISMVGYKSQQYTIRGEQTNLTFSLEKDMTGIEEVVVTGLGVKREKKALGYAVSSISTEQLTDLGSPVNAMTTLYGQVPGLRVSATALGPSGGLNINIRNAVAFAQGSNVRPLFVIDGIPMLDWQTNLDRNPGNGLNDLNLDDIETFEILRGAKASLLYGSQGANGVILITSKSGRKRPGFGVDVNLSHQVDQPWILQELQNEFGSGYPITWDGYGNYSEDGFYKRNDQEAFVPVTYNFGPRLDGRDLLWYDNETRPYVAQPDNIKNLYRKGSTSVANVSIQGGGAIGGFRLAYTHKDYQGIFEGFNMSDNQVTFNGNMNITDRVYAQLVSTYSQTFNHNSPARQQDAFVTYGLPRNLDTKLLRDQVIDPVTGYSYWRMEDRSSTMNPGSIVRDQLSENYFFSQWNDTYDNLRNHFRNSINLNIALTDALSIDAIGGFDWIINDKNTNVVLRRPLSQGSGGTNSMANDQDVRWNAQAMLRYERHLNNPDFHFSGFVGTVYQHTSTRSFSRTTRDGFITRDWASLNNSKNDMLRSGSGLGAESLYGLFASAQLGYKDYLFLELQGRNDWSSILPPNNNSYFYPGASVAWVFSEIIQRPDWLSMGKVRASWADVGRPGSRYFANEVYNIGAYASTITYTAPALIPPLDLKPERKREFEIGFDMSFLQNRLGVEFSYFNANTYNQIMPLSIAGSTGYTSVGINAGQIATKGWEAFLNLIPVRTKDFEWRLIVNSSAATPKVKKLDMGITTQNLWGMQGARVVAKTGEPYGQIIVTPYATDDNGNRLVNSSGLYYTDGTKEKIVGKVIPDFTGGITSNFQYKGFILGLNFDAQFGSTLVSQTNMYMLGNGSGKETLFGRDEATGGLPYYVTDAGKYTLLDNHDSALPDNSKYPMIFHDGVILPGVKEDGTANDIIIAAADKYAYYWRGSMDIQEDMVYKNDYVKLRNVTFSYALPKAMTSKMGFERLLLTVFANNIGFLYRTLPNVDPESFNGTNVFYENNAFPTTKSYGMSIRATF